ncbi:MAG TPA: hypothetical protein VHL11_02665 [Phototrophicaceae bacterium]|jgi:hypothetical protein|nr:hypothetical protein [Phototrophicaceae bacterium]
MARLAQLGIALGLLGIILTLMGLFPGVTGVKPTPTIGIVQLAAILTGFALLILGALLYVKVTFYPGIPSNLLQQIGTRLALTGLLFAALSGLADILGFGSHTRAAAADAFIGPLQAVGVIGSFLVSALGVLLYVMSGPEDEN